MKKKSKRASHELRDVFFRMAKRTQKTIVPTRRRIHPLEEKGRSKWPK
jgi:hypothetical protein